MKLRKVQGPTVGMIVTRWLAGVVQQDMKITAVTDEIITCDEMWTFDRKTGAEIDEDLGWGPPPRSTGSFITEKEDNDS